MFMVRKISNRTGILPQLWLGLLGSAALASVLTTTVSASPAQVVEMELDGMVSSIQPLAEDCVYEGEFGLTGQLDGRLIEGQAHAQWTDTCIAELLGNRVQGVTNVELAENAVRSTTDDNTDGFMISGKAVNWLEPLLGESSLAGTNPKDFHFNGLASKVDTHL